jgi:outer membrane protein assembly factor BamD (BamD/ComL family)
MIHNKALLFWILSILLMVSPGFIMADPGQEQIESDIAVEEGQYDDAIKLMESYIDRDVEKTLSSKVNYLLALSLFHKTRIDINECRERNEIGTQLKTEQADAMKRAEKHFLKANELNPTGPEADDSLYFAGVIQDYGCLNHFSDAIQTFQKLLEDYPDSEHAEDAKIRLNKFQGHNFD